MGLPIGPPAATKAAEEATARKASLEYMVEDLDYH